MRAFRQISLVNITSLEATDLEEIQKLSENKLVQVSDFDNWRAEIPDDTDCLLVSLFVRVSKREAESLASLRYVGVYGTNLNKIDVPESVARTRVTGYCDEETAEFCFNKLKAWGPDQPVGIIGLGSVGYELASLLRKAKVEVMYWSRNQKPRADKELGIIYLPKQKLLKTVKSLSLHVAPDLEILGESDFKSFGNDKRILNTCIGPVMGPSALKKWLLSDANNFLYLDSIAARPYASLLALPNVEAHHEPAYLKDSSLQKRRQYFIRNIKDYLSA